MALRIVLMGTGDFAVPSFRRVIESHHDAVAIYTQPDRSGRGHHRHRNPVKELGEQHGIPVLQPARINTAEELKTLESHRADLFLVAAYGQILSQKLLDISRLGAFNLHGSLLPRHRGAAPVQYSIWKGDQQAGVTMFQIQLAMDSGPMVGKVSTEIATSETSGQLMQRLAELSPDLTMTALNQLENGSATFEAQDDSFVTLAPKIRKEDGIIDWNQTAREIDCQIRAMQPWPKAVSWLRNDAGNSDRVVLLEASPKPDDIPPGDLPDTSPGSIAVHRKRLFVGTGDGLLELKRLQLDGRKPVDAAAFLNGYTMPTQPEFESPNQ